MRAASLSSSVNPLKVSEVFFGHIFPVLTILFEAKPRRGGGGGVKPALKPVVRDAKWRLWNGATNKSQIRCQLFLSNSRVSLHRLSVFRSWMIKSTLLKMQLICPLPGTLILCPSLPSPIRNILEPPLSLFNCSFAAALSNKYSGWRNKQSHIYTYIYICIFKWHVHKEKGKTLLS